MRVITGALAVATWAFIAGIFIVGLMQLPTLATWAGIVAAIVLGGYLANGRT